METKQKKQRIRHFPRKKPGKLVMLSQPQIDMVNDSLLVSLLGEMLALDLKGLSYTPNDYDSSWAVYLAMNRGLVKEVPSPDISYELTRGESGGKSRAITMVDYFRLVMGYK